MLGAEPEDERAMHSVSTPPAESNADAAGTYCQVQITGVPSLLRVDLRNGFAQTSVAVLRRRILLEAVAKHALPPRIAEIIERATSSSLSAPVEDASAAITDAHDVPDVVERIEIRLLFQGRELKRDGAALTHYHIHENGAVVQANFAAVALPPRTAAMTAALAVSPTHLPNNADEARQLASQLAQAIRTVLDPAAGGTNDPEADEAAATATSGAATRHLTNAQLLDLLYEERRHRRAAQPQAMSSSPGTAAAAATDEGGMAEVPVEAGADDEHDGEPEEEDELTGEALIEAAQYSLWYSLALGMLTGPVGFLFIRTPTEMVGLIIGNIFWLIVAAVFRVISLFLEH